MLFAFAIHDENFKRIQPVHCPFYLSGGRGSPLYRGWYFFMKKAPLNIWNDIERCWVMRLDIVIEGQTVSGIHNSEFEDVVNEYNDE